MQCTFEQICPAGHRIGCKLGMKPPSHGNQGQNQAAPHIPVIGFPRLAGPMLADYASRTGMQGIGMDTAMDPRWAAANVAPEMALQGNLDPLVLMTGGIALETEARSLLSAMRGRPFIFNLGHGIEKETPIEHVTALLRHVRGG